MTLEERRGAFAIAARLALGFATAVAVSVAALVAAARDARVQTPVSPAAPTAPAPASVPGRFFASYDELVIAARQAGRPSLVLIGEESSRWSRRLAKESWSEAALGALASGAEGVRAWRGEAATGKGAELLRVLGAREVPLTLCLDAEGRLADRLDGYLAPERYREELARMLRGEGTRADLALRASRAPEDAEARAALAEKLAALGDAAGAERELAVLRELDRARLTRPLRREAYGACLSRVEEHFQRTREINPGPLVRFLEEERRPELRFEGLLMLASLHRRRAGELEEAQQLQAARAKRGDLRVVLARAAQDLPERPDVRVEFALETISTFGESADELSDVDKATMEKLAQSAVLLAPEDARVHAALAAACFVRGDRAAARAALTRAFELEGDHPEWHSLAQALGL